MCGAVFIQDITFFFDVTKCFVTKPVIEAALKEKLSMFLKKKKESDVKCSSSTVNFVPCNSTVKKFFTDRCQTGHNA